MKDKQDVYLEEMKKDVINAIKHFDSYNFFLGFPVVDDGSQLAQLKEFHRIIQCDMYRFFLQLSDYCNQINENNV